uniref:Uncharacterized protein n=1 Tax=Nelumbo nucifera TaxID=4432 RepID=A0A822YK16_NELNU|nr:TPA_asm: hypothetical protein HUJ06_010510 [Nelumbo nucifera]
MSFYMKSHSELILRALTSDISYFCFPTHLEDKFSTETW